jgi:parallel beta-helix repeat protein
VITNVYQGISIGGSDNLIVSGNIIENCTKGSGITEGMYSNENIMLSNNIITNCKGDGIYLFSYKNSYVINNTLRNNSGSGISVDASMNCTISNNIIRGNKYEGIDLSDSGWKGGDKNTVSNNDVSGNGGIGIDILGSYNTITNNTVNGNLGGISLASAGLTYIVAGNNIISHNTASNNKRNGLDLDFHCEGNTISYNTFASNNAANEYDSIEWDSEETVPRWYDMRIYDENNTFTDNTYGTIYIYK